MRAITVWQPYASLIEAGFKKYEVRSYGTKFRGRLLICSAKKSMRWILENADENAVDAAIEYFGINNFTHLPTGKAICYVDLVDCIEITKELIAKLPSEELKVADWPIGHFAWRFSSPKSVDRVPIEGGQAIWHIDNKLVRPLCCICNEPMDFHNRHNAEPVKKGSCCSKCNLEVVIPARVKIAEKGGYW